MTSAKKGEGGQCRGMQEEVYEIRCPFSSLYFSKSLLKLSSL